MDDYRYIIKDYIIYIISKQVQGTDQRLKNSQLQH